jgi:integrase
LPNAQPRTIITPEQFAVLYGCLPDAQSKLLVETAVESGLRWGELTELRVRDLDFATRMLTVSRAVVQVQPRFHPDGGRFLVKPYPKDKEYRRFKLSTQITAKLRAHVVEHDLGRDDLLFEMPVEERPRVRVPRLDADIDALGRTEPNARWPPLPARHADRILTRPLPLRLLPGDVLPLPGRAARQRQGRPARPAGM